MPHRGVSGRLHVDIYIDASAGPKLKAVLLDSKAGSTAELLPVLYGAHVRRITSNGILIAGYEVIARRRNTKAATDHYLDLAEMDEFFRPHLPGTMPR